MSGGGRHYQIREDGRHEKCNQVEVQRLPTSNERGELTTSKYQIATL